MLYTNLHFTFEDAKNIYTKTHLLQQSSYYVSSPADWPPLDWYQLVEYRGYLTYEYMLLTDNLLRS